ncbi:hypothetical protein BSM4216_1040 [Bacillus smithii]|nr:hypothetical protein BSM4216_1040 [Bacillus smithii]
MKGTTSASRIINKPAESRKKKGLLAGCIFMINYFQQEAGRRHLLL